MAVLTEAQDEASPDPAMLLNLISSTEGLPHPHFPPAQPHFGACKGEFYVGSRCVHPGAGSPPSRESLPAPRRAATAKFLYCLEQSQWHPRPEVTVCTTAAGGVSGHPKGCALCGSQLAGANGWGTP